MEGKKLIALTNISFTNGTRIITLATGSLVNTLLSGDITRIFFIYNDTQKKYYYAPEESISLTTVSADNQLTIDGTLPVLATGDKLKILIWDADNTENQNLGYKSVGEISPARSWSDSAISQTTTLTVNTWVSFGSSITGEQNTTFAIFNKWTGVSTVTAVQIKVVGRFDQVSTENYGMPCILFDKNTRAIELEDTTDVFTKIYQLDVASTQNFLMFLQFGNTVPSIELYIKAIGSSVTSAAHVTNIVKAWASAIPCNNPYRNFALKTLAAATNIAAATNYYPTSTGELMGANQAAFACVITDATLTFEMSYDGSTWFDCTRLGVVTGDLIGSTSDMQGQSGLASYTAGTYTIEFSEINYIYMRVKAVTADTTNGISIKLKKDLI